MESNERIREGLRGVCDGVGVALGRMEGREGGSSRMCLGIWCWRA